MIRKRRKKISSSSPLIVGAWFMLFAVYGQVACDDESTGGTGGTGADATTFDGSDPADATTDVTTDVTADVVADTATVDEIGDFADAAGSYSSSGTGASCGINSFALAIGTSIVANSFGTNGAVTFKLMAGSKNVAEASNLMIFSKPNHKCRLTKTRAGVSLDCDNPTPEMCGPQPFTK